MLFDPSLHQARDMPSSIVQNQEKGLSHGKTRRWIGQPHQILVNQQVAQEQISHLQSVNPILWLDQKVLEFILVGSSIIPHEQLPEFSTTGIV